MQYMINMNLVTCACMYVCMYMYVVKMFMYMCVHVIAQLYIHV